MAASCMHTLRPVCCNSLPTTFSRNGAFLIEWRVKRLQNSSHFPLWLSPWKKWTLEIFSVGPSLAQNLWRKGQKSGSLRSVAKKKKDLWQMLLLREENQRKERQFQNLCVIQPSSYGLGQNISHMEQHVAGYSPGWPLLGTQHGRSTRQGTSCWIVEREILPGYELEQGSHHLEGDNCCEFYQNLGLRRRGLHSGRQSSGSCSFAPVCLDSSCDAAVLVSYTVQHLFCIFHLQQSIITNSCLKISHRVFHEFYCGLPASFVVMYSM